MKKILKFALAAVILCLTLSACADPPDDRYGIWSKDWNPVMHGDTGK